MLLLDSGARHKPLRFLSDFAPDLHLCVDAVNNNNTEDVHGFTALHTASAMYRESDVTQDLSIDINEKQVSHGSTSK